MAYGAGVDVGSTQTKAIIVDDHRHPASLVVGHLQPRLGDGLLRCSRGELLKPVSPSRLARLHERGRVEALHLAGDPHQEIRSVEKRDRRHARDPAHHLLPRLAHAQAEGAHGPHPGNDYPRRHLFLPHLALKPEPVNTATVGCRSSEAIAASAGHTAAVRWLMDSTKRSSVRSHAPDDAASAWLPEAKSAVGTRLSVEVFGEGQVSTYVILGMGEDPDLTVEGCRRAIDIGVYPFIVPLRPVPGSLLEDLLPPDAAYTESIYRRVVPYLLERGIGSWTVSSGCARCQACSGMSLIEQEYLELSSAGDTRTRIPVRHVD